MEESENRKARLRAMRMEAAEVEASPKVESSTSSAHLSNPLAESSTLQESSPVAARFDFYTDPMAAFSGNRRKSQKTAENSPDYFSTPKNSTSPGPGNPNIFEQPCPPYNQSPCSDQRMNREPLSYHNMGSWRSPSGTGSPSLQQPGTHAGWSRPGGTVGYGFPPNSPRVGGFPPSSPSFPPNSPRVGGFPPSSPSFRHNSPTVSDFHSPSFGRGGSPCSESGVGYQFNNTPNSSFGQRGSLSSSAGRGGRYHVHNNPNPGFGQGSYSSPNSGRGSGNRFGSSPSTGTSRGRGRGRGFHGNVSAREKPEIFCQHSMLEDPWRLLVPVVRKINMEEESSSTPASSKSWFPKSISKKKEKDSDAGARPRLSGISFAESLAASYEEAAALASSNEGVANADDVNNV